MTQKLVIRLLNGTQQGRKFGLETAGEFQLGRSPDADIILPDNSVSGRHATLSHDGQYWYLRDLGSRNGTTVNNLPIGGTAVALPPQGVMCFASIQAQFWHDPPQARPAPWPPAAQPVQPVGPQAPPPPPPPRVGGTSPTSFGGARATVVDGRPADRGEPQRTMADTPIPAWQGVRERDNLADASLFRQVPESLLGDPQPRQEPPWREPQSDPRPASSLWNVAPVKEAAPQRPPTPPAVPVNAPPRSDPKVMLKQEPAASLWEGPQGGPSSPSSGQHSSAMPPSLASLLNDWKPPALNPEPASARPPSLPAMKVEPAMPEVASLLSGPGTASSASAPPSAEPLSLFAEFGGDPADQASPWSAAIWAPPPDEAPPQRDGVQATRASVPVVTGAEGRAPSSSAQDNHELTPGGRDRTTFDATGRTPWSAPPSSGPTGQGELTRTATVPYAPESSGGSGAHRLDGFGHAPLSAVDEPERQRLQEELQQARQELEAQRAEAQILRAQLAPLQSELAGVRADLTNLQHSSSSELQRLQGELQSLASELERARQSGGEAQALRPELQRLQQEQSALEETLRTAQDEVQRLSTELIAVREASSGELQRSQSEVARLNAELQAARQGASAELQRAQQELTRLGADLQAARQGGSADVLRAQQEIARLNADLQAARQGGSAEVQRLQSELTRVTTDMQTLRQSAGAEVQRLQQELLKAQAELGRAQPELVRLQTENAALRQQGVERNQELEGLRARMVSLQQALQEADQALKGGGKGPDLNIATVFRQSIAFLESFGESLESLASCLAAGTDPTRARNLLREISYKLGDLRGILEEGRRISSGR